MHLTMDERAALGSRPEPGRAWAWGTWRTPPGRDPYGRAHPPLRSYRYLYTHRNGGTVVGGYGHSLVDAFRRARFHFLADPDNRGAVTRPEVVDGTGVPPDPGSLDSRPLLLSLLADALDRGPLDAHAIRARLAAAHVPPPGTPAPPDPQARPS